MWIHNINCKHTVIGKLREIMKRHQVLIAESEAEATHIIHSAADPLVEEYARPVFRRDRSTLIHWYFVFSYFIESFTKIYLKVLFPRFIR